MYIHILNGKKLDKNIHIVDVFHYLNIYKSIAKIKITL